LGDDDRLTDSILAGLAVDRRSMQIQFSTGAWLPVGVDVLISLDAQSMAMDSDDRQNAWNERYLASIAEEQRALDAHDQSFYGKSIRLHAYVREAIFLAGLMIGAIAMITTRNPLWMLAGAVLIATVLLGIIGMALGRARTQDCPGDPQRSRSRRRPRP
jgi:hypothetical protein